MGGAAGHLQNAWEASDLTFDDIRDLTHEALHGNLNGVTEKIDGQNLMLTWRNDEVLCARTGKHRREFGRPFGITVYDIREFFGPSTPEPVKTAYKRAMEDFQLLFSQTKDFSDEFFQEGKYWMNAEILNTETENVIHYGTNQIRIHNVIKVDVNGKQVGVSEFSTHLLEWAEKYRSELFYEIKGTNNVQFKKIVDVAEIEAIFIKESHDIQRTYYLNNTSTIGLYMHEAIYDYIDLYMPKKILGKKEVIDITLAFANRWAYKDKSITITTLLKDKDQDIVKWFKAQDKIIDFEIKKILKPFMVYFLKLSVVVLQNLDGLTVQNAWSSNIIIKDKAKAAIKYATEHLEDIPDRKILDRLIFNMELFFNIGSLESIAVTEGIVFTYKNKLLKLTGAFSPLIQLIGFYKYK